MSDREVSDKDTVAERCVMMMLNSNCVGCKVVTCDNSCWERRKKYMREYNDQETVSYIYQFYCIPKVDSDSNNDDNPDPDVDADDDTNADSMCQLTELDRNKSSDLTSVGRDKILEITCDNMCRISPGSIDIGDIQVCRQV